MALQKYVFKPGINREGTAYDNIILLKTTTHLMTLPQLEKPAPTL